MTFLHKKISLADYQGISIFFAAATAKYIIGAGALSEKERETSNSGKRRPDTW